jgi:FAD/FMN-containing dehydrogenase
MEQLVEREMLGLSEAALAALRAGMAGAVITPADAGYDEARAAWNLVIDQRPTVVVAPQSAAEVSAAVRWAAAQGLGVKVQATGHGASRSGDGAMLILTRNLNELRVDAAAQTAWVGAGLKWGPVLAKAQEVGLAPLLGSSPGVGAVGYTLGGGMGWLARKYGLSVDSVNAFEVVLADGRIVRASATENTDLFWGLRGSAGSLGIVTGMEIRLYPVTTVYGGNLFYPVELAREVLQRYRVWIETLPDEMTTSAVLMNVPPLPDVPDMLRGKSFVIVRGCYVGPAAEGAALLDFWREWQPAAIDMFQEMPFTGVAGISMDPEGPVPGLGSGEWLTAMSDEAIEVMLRYGTPQGGPPAFLKTEIHHAGGRMSQAPGEGAAFSHREQRLLVHVVGIAPTPEAVRAVHEAIAGFRTGLAPVLTGATYTNFLDGEEKWARTAEAFTAQALRRLQALKTEYDPQNLFRYGLDIRPAG